MIFTCEDMRKYVVADTLRYLGEWSKSAENLLVGTAIQESGMGFCMKSGRKIGLYHISTAAHRAVWDQFLVHLPDTASQVRGLAGQHAFVKNPHKELLTNLRYATAIAWMIYRKAQCKLPPAEDIEGLARIWHRYFHCQPSGTVKEFVRNYREMTSVRHLRAA